MALSYEEALSTLESMFSESSSAWTRESLDAVLRFQKGHMENTVDFILRHINQNPQLLMEQLQAGVNPDESTTRMDAELARQLAQTESTTSHSSGARGTPTLLPEDFLRIPGYNPADYESDEALARRLQQEENQQQQRERRTSAPRRVPPTQQRTAAPPIGPVLQQNLQSVQKHLNEFGENVTSQFRMLASRFNKNGARSEEDDVTPAAERRGLLDEEEELEFARR
ncbi:hypothetical protein FisN_6Lh341 [Fistulifera solaris]|uniref:CUE domain-containing protein n=1 Tax=Fistulifera solaris TaxID=1519565 RepID=A0A1Z5JKL7_FISSO|nr:hypothetical protein FisN_6Lh341 [Fistulifera solaris]|eukprot:GAX14563.1 hypothetical protein FisN_6Lh341 [Fistulifera solaris]